MQGRDKLLEPIDGVPMLARQVNAALATGLNVLVMIRPNDAERRAVLPQDPKLEISIVHDADEGMAATLRTAATAASGLPLMILLPDIPGITTADIQSVLSAFKMHHEKKVVRASDAKDRPGTPICLPAEIAARLLELEGDEGGQRMLRGQQVELVRFDTDRATHDLDTPEDWVSWRADNAGS